MSGINSGALGATAWLLAGIALGCALGIGMTTQKLEAHAPACEEVVG